MHFSESVMGPWPAQLSMQGIVITSFCSFIPLPTIEFCFSGGFGCLLLGIEKQGGINIITSKLLRWLEL